MTDVELRDALEAALEALDEKVARLRKELSDAQRVQTILKAQVTEPDEPDDDEPEPPLPVPEPEPDLVQVKSPRPIEH